MTKRLTILGSTGFLYGLLSLPTSASEFEKVIRVLAVGKTVKTWINGNFVIEQVIPDNRHETNSSGYVALQCADKHGIKPGVTYKIAFKNIRIREIASSARK